MKVCIDNRVIGRDTYQEHINVTRKVCKILKEVGIWFTKEKYQVLPARLQILGHILTKNRLEAEPTKIEQVNQFPKATNIRQLQKFMGIINYLRKFAPNLVVVAAPLSELQRST